MRDGEAAGRGAGDLRGRGRAWAAESPVALFLSIRIGYLLLTALALLWVPARGEGLPRFFAWGGLSDLLFGTFQHWDANWTIQIVQDGYTAQSAAFMPVYPGLVWLLGHVTGSNLVAAVLISIVAAAIGVHFVAEIAAKLLGRTVARDAVLLVSIYPIAYVFTSAYSEGLFLATAAAAVYAAMRDRYWLAGLLAAGAVGTRLFGLALIPCLVVLAWPEARRRGLTVLAPVIALPLAALVAVSLFFGRTLGDALAFVHAQKYWDRELSPAGPFGGAWDSLSAAASGLKTIVLLPSRAGAPGGFDASVQRSTWDLVDFAILAAAVALTVLVFRRLGPALGLYSAGLLVIAVSSPVSGRQEVLQSIGRFVLMDFPIFIAAASLLSGSPRARAAMIGALTAIGAMACFAFSRMLWVA